MAAKGQVVCSRQRKCNNAQEIVHDTRLCGKKKHFVRDYRRDFWEIYLNTLTSLKRITESHNQCKILSVVC